MLVGSPLRSQSDTLLCFSSAHLAPVVSVLMSSLLSPSGWGELYRPPQKVESSSAPVDNGTSAWGKPMDTGPNWEGPGRESTRTSTWDSTTGGQQLQHKHRESGGRVGVWPSAHNLSHVASIDLD